jgi:hypothetical protein
MDESFLPISLVHLACPSPTPTVQKPLYNCPYIPKMPSECFLKPYSDFAGLVCPYSDDEISLPSCIQPTHSEPPDRRHSPLRKLFYAPSHIL